jgi:hypothetical protein
LGVLIGFRYNKKQEDNFVKKLNIKYFDYTFIEETVKKKYPTFMNDICELFENKNILLISPFGSYMKKQYYENKDNIFEYKHPLKCKSLDYVNSYITYNNKTYNKNLPHTCFNETLEDLKKQIKEKSFDVAFLSCGAYAMPLGLYIKKELKKQAIYIGGVMQIMFGIKGRRFKTYRKQNKYWINAPQDMLCEDIKNKIKNENGENFGREYF